MNFGSAAVPKMDIKKQKKKFYQLLKKFMIIQKRIKDMKKLLCKIFGHILPPMAIQDESEYVRCGRCGICEYFKREKL